MSFVNEWMVVVRRLDPCAVFKFFCLLQKYWHSITIFYFFRVKNKGIQRNDKKITKA